MTYTKTKGHEGKVQHEPFPICLYLRIEGRVRACSNFKATWTFQFQLSTPGFSFPLKPKISKHQIKPSTSSSPLFLSQKGLLKSFLL
jgi:hypothetical protein